MPAIPLGAALLISGAATAGATAYGAHKSASAAKEAGKVQEKGTADALAFQREQAAEDRRRYDQQISMERAQWDADQARRAPYRAAAAQILSRRTGIPVEPYQPTFQPSATIGSLARGPQAPSMQRGTQPTLGMLARR